MCNGNVGLCLGQRWCCGLGGWSRITELAPLFLCCNYVHATVAVVSTLVRGRVGVLRVWSCTSELALLFPSACTWWRWWSQIWLEAGPWPKGFELNFWIGPTFSQCESAHDRNGSLCLSKEQSWSRMGRGRSLVRAGNCARAVLAGWPKQQAVFNLLPLFWNWDQASLCACSSRAESQFLTALWEPPLVFKPSKGTHLPGAWPQDWGARYNAWTPCSLGRPPSRWYPTLLLGHLLRVQVWTRSLFLPSSQTLCGSFLFKFFYSFGCRKAMLLVVRSFSARIALYVAVVLMCSWEEVSSGSSYSTMLIPPLLL